MENLLIQQEALEFLSETSIILMDCCTLQQSYFNYKFKIGMRDECGEVIFI